MSYWKLVRDKIPDIILQNSEEPVIRIASKIEYTELLVKKLLEEAHEFVEERNPEELADILEVVYAIAQDQWIDQNWLNAIYQKKHHERGGFEKRIILEGINEKS